MSHYRRNRVCGGSYFFTVNLLDRSGSLLVDHIDDVRRAVAKVRLQKPFLIDAWVVLPDHMHAVWTLPENCDDYSSRWRDIKKYFSAAVNINEYRSPNRVKRKERGIWQRRFWEHTIQSERDYWLHMDYVHLNPLKHQLVDHVKDWPYSSFHRYVKQGIYPPDWCG